MGQTLGLFAFGNVARCTARRAKAFGMHVIAYDPYVSELEISALGVEPVSLGSCSSAATSSRCTRRTTTRRATCDQRAALSTMKRTAVIVNTARGPIIDEAALIEALSNGEIAGAGLDVLEEEPPSQDNPLLHMENVSSRRTSRRRAAHAPETRRRAAREVALVLRGRWPMSCVNPTVLPRVTLERWQPYPMSRGPIAEGTYFSLSGRTRRN